MANNNSKLDISTFDPKKIQGFIDKKGTADVSIGIPSSEVTPQIGIGSTDAKLPSIAQEIAAPVAPIATKPIAPVAPAPEVSPVSKEQIRTNITSSFGKAGTQGVANAAAVRGLLKFSDQPVTEERVNELTGMRLGELVEQVNPALAEQIPGFMVRDEVKTEVTPTGVTDRLTTEVTDVTEAPKSASDQLKSLLGTLPSVKGKARERAVQEVGLGAKRQAVSDARSKANEALGTVNRLKRGLEIAEIEDFREEEAILGSGTLKSAINADLQRLSRDQQFDRMQANIEVGIAIDEYNTRLAEVQIAQGNYSEAEKIVSKTADQAFEGAELHIKALEALGEIEKEEATSLRKDLEKERDLKLNGYVPLEGTLADNLVGNDRDMLFEDPTSKKVYRRPEDKAVADEIRTIGNQIVKIKNGRAEVIFTGAEDGKISESERKEAAKLIEDNNNTLEKAESALPLVIDLLNSPALGSATGGTSVLPVLPGTEKANFIAKLDTLKALLTLENMGIMKGVLSDGDMKVITNASTSLKRNMTEGEFKKELGRIKNSFEKAKFNVKGYPSLKEYIRINPEDAEKSKQIKRENPELEPLDVLQVLQPDISGSFSMVGSDTKQASTGTGNRPQRNNNPGNVKRGGIGDKFAKKGPDGKVLTDEVGHLIFPNPEAGFNALKQDVKAKITGRSRVVKSPNPTIAEVGRAFAEDPNWAKGVARLIGTDVNTKARSVDFNKLINAIATQEGFFA